MPRDFFNGLIEESLIANNSTSNGFGTDIRSVGDMPGSFTSNGGNLIGSTDSATFGMPGLRVSDYYDQSVDYVVTALRDTLNHSDDPLVVSLRDAIDTANTTTGTQTIWLPAWHFIMTHSGGDYDIDDGHTIIVGSGAGATIINGAGLATRDRIFETLTGGSLDLSRVTLTGGQTVNDGGAIRVNNNTMGGVRELTLSEVVIFGNTATNANGHGSGGGIYVASNAEAHILRSVVTSNTAQSIPTGNGGGGIYAGGQHERQARTIGHRQERFRQRRRERLEISLRRHVHKFRRQFAHERGRFESGNVRAVGNRLCEPKC